MTVIIVLLLAAYLTYVLRRRMRQIKNGNYCGCGCSDCGADCARKKEEEL